jgi:Dolichyl-phosphate-mannose-protein mannosyltransferase
LTQWLQRMAQVIRLNREVCAPLLVAALLRLGLMIAAFARTGSSVMTQGDTASYLGPGRNLILHGVFANAGMPEIDRTPGYPWFAEITGMVCGNVLLTAVAQILVALISLLLVRKIADLVFPNRNAGSTAAWLYAFEPLSIVYSVRLMPETLFVLLLLLVIERLLAFQRSGRLAALAAAGALLAAATFVRPVSYYLVFALAAGISITAPKQRGLWWKAPAVLLISVLPWLAAWQMRNFAETGYSGFSSIVEKNLYFFQSAEVSAELQHISLGEEQKQLGYPEDKYYFAAHPEQRAWSQSQRLSFMRTQAMQTLSSHPGLYLRTHFAGVGVVAFTPCATEFLQLIGAYPAGDAMPHRIVNEGVAASVERVILSHPGVAITMALLEGFLLFLYLSAIRGCLGADSVRPALLALCGIALYFLLISGGAQAVGRYRLPVMPELCIFAAGGLTRGQRKTAEP